MEEILNKLKDRVSEANSLLEDLRWDLIAIRESMRKSLDNTEGLKAEIDEQFIRIEQKLNQVGVKLNDSNL